MCIVSILEYIQKKIENSGEEDKEYMAENTM